MMVIAIVALTLKIFEGNTGPLAHCGEKVFHYDACAFVMKSLLSIAFYSFKLSKDNSW